jgi:hypothetical protein
MRMRGLIWGMVFGIYQIFVLLQLMEAFNITKLSQKITVVEITNLAF